MKKIMIVAAAIALLLVKAEASLQGVYGGIQGGTQTLTAKHQTNWSQIGNELGHAGGQAGLFAGYGHMIHDCYLAIQADANIGGYQNSLLINNVTDSIVRTKANSIYGIAGLIGYQPINNMVAYVRVGADFAKWSITSDGVSEHLKTSKTLTGLGSGIGIRALVANNVFFDMSYKFTFFRKMNLVNDSGDNTKPRVQTFTIGFAYKY